MSGREYCICYKTVVVTVSDLRDGQQLCISVVQGEGKCFSPPIRTALLGVSPPPPVSSVQNMFIWVSHLCYYVLNTFLPNVVYLWQGRERIYAGLVLYFYQSSVNNFQPREFLIFLPEVFRYVSLFIYFSPDNILTGEKNGSYQLIYS